MSVLHQANYSGVVCPDATVSTHGDDRSPSFFLIGVIHGALTLRIMNLSHSSVNKTLVVFSEQISQTA